MFSHINCLQFWVNNQTKHAKATRNNFTQRFVELATACKSRVLRGKLGRELRYVCYCDKSLRSIPAIKISQFSSPQKKSSRKKIAAKMFSGNFTPLWKLYTKIAFYVYCKIMLVPWSAGNGSIHDCHLHHWWWLLQRSRIHQVNFIYS